MTSKEFPCNFRSILTCGKSPPIYRSSDPDIADEAVVSKLYEDLNIKTIIDLRNASEIKQYVAEKSPLSIRYPQESASNALAGHFSASTCLARRINVSFTNWKYKLKVFLSFPIKIKMAVTFLYIKSLLTQDAEDVERYGGKHFFNEMQQWQMYATFIEFGTDTVKNIFNIFLRRDLYGILINCHAGKDRTGVICALVMDLLGYSQQEIIDEYSKSEILLHPMQDQVDQSFIRRELDPEVFGKAPARTMETFLDYFYKRYTNTNAYLRQLGFTPQDIDEMKHNLQNADA